MSALANCPFCGGKASRQVNKLDHGGVTYETGCDNVGCLVLPSAMQLSAKYADETWNTRSGQLITLAEAQAMVAAETERCATFCEGNSVGHTTRGYIIDKWEYEVNGGTHSGQAYAAAIRAAATGTKEGE